MVIVFVFIFWKCPSECKTKFNTRFSQVMLFEVKIACNNHIWSTMVGKWVVNERNRDFPSFFKGQICTFANETEVFHKGYFGQSVLDFIFPWFCPVFVPRWFCITRQEFASCWFTTVKAVFWRIGNGNHQKGLIKRSHRFHRFTQIYFFASKRSV